MQYTILNNVFIFRSGANRAKTSAQQFAQKYNLGDPIFGNFYQAEYDSYVDILHAQLKG